MILSEHLVRCDTDGIDFKTPWYKWTNGRLQQIFLMVSFLLHSGRKYYCRVIVMKMTVLAMFQEICSQFKNPSSN